MNPRAAGKKSPEQKQITGRAMGARIFVKVKNARLAARVEIVGARG